MIRAFVWAERMKRAREEGAGLVSGVVGEGRQLIDGQSGRRGAKLVRDWGQRGTSFSRQVEVERKRREKLTRNPQWPICMTLPASSYACSALARLSRRSNPPSLLDRPVTAGLASVRMAFPIAIRARFDPPPPPPRLGRASEPAEASDESPPEGPAVPLAVERERGMLGRVDPVVVEGCVPSTSVVRLRNGDGAFSALASHFAGEPR